MVVFVNKLTLTGAAEDLERIYGRVAEFMLTQPGLIRYQLVRSQNDPRIYFNIAEWQDAESFQKALAEPEFKTRLKALGTVIRGEPHLSDVVTADNVERTVKELTARGITADGVPADVCSRTDVARCVAAAVDRFGPIDILVNNAGRSGGGVTAEIPDEIWYGVIETNLNSVFRMTREVLTTGGMAAKPTGRIINIASTGGKQGVVLGAPYSASKHAVVGLTKALGLELAKTGITVNAVCPGYVETPLAERVRAGYAQAWQVSTDEVLTRFNAKIPLGRYSTPDEVAGMVVYLASAAAASVTAQAINVCGGLGNY